MYRYSDTNEIVYTPDDLILFRESPFASWMERLTLENPDHGIAPDPVKEGPGRVSRRQAMVVAPADPHWGGSRLGWEEFVNGVSVEREPVRQPDTDFSVLLRAQGRDVVSISRHLSEAERRCATARAMRAGAQYIVDGQLALGPMACRVDMLIRCDGVSEFGNYQYVPCATGGNASGHMTHKLCFAADLLKSLQGTAPADLLVMKPGEDMACFNAQDHMHRFNELKYEFMTAQLSFRKHRVPDPAQSSHFGRWSRCAREMLAQRAGARELRTAQAAVETATPVGTDRARQQPVELAPRSKEGLASAMTRAIMSGRDVSRQDDLIDRDAPGGERGAGAAMPADQRYRYGRG